MTHYRVWGNPTVNGHDLDKVPAKDIEKKWSEKLQEEKERVSNVRKTGKGGEGGQQCHELQHGQGK